MVERVRGSRAPLVAAVFLVALCLRPALTSVGPVLSELGAQEGLGETALGLLGALPLLAFAGFSPLVHLASARFGADRTVLWALLGLAAGIVVRSWTGAAGLWLGTLLVGAATAVGNVLVPAIVKRDYAGDVSRATGGYSATMGAAAAVASAVAVPLAAVSGWRLALGAWVALVVPVAAVWWARTRVAPPPEAHAAEPSGDGVWRSRTAWLVTAFMALQSVTFYVLVTWLPTIEAAEGVSARAAGVHLFVFQVLGIVGGLAIPLVMRDRDDQVAAGVVASVGMAVSAVGLLLSPALVLVWVVLAGLGSGASLVVGLGLIGLRGQGHHGTARLSGMAQSLGYLVAAAGPVAAGVLAERTGTWQAALVLVATLAWLQVGVAVVAGRPPCAITPS